MKFLTVLFFLILSLAGFAAAQDNSDKKQKFNGIWIFDAKKSDVGSNGKRLYKGQILEISYNEPELKIAKTQTMEGKAKTVTLLFYTDNRGEKNKPYPFNETLEIASNTAWSKDTIVRKFTINVYNSGNLTSGLKNQE